MSVLYLTGVLEDATIERAPEVPVNPRQTLDIIQRTTNQIILSATDPAGLPLPAIGDLILTIKQKPQDEPSLARLVGTWTPMLGPGKAIFSWTTATMAQAAWGRYVYDVRLVNGSEVNMLIPASPFILSPAV